MCYLLSFNIVTHPPDPLPPTIVQWCVVLSRSAIGVVVVGIAATVVAAAAVAPSSPAAPPDVETKSHGTFKVPCVETKSHGTFKIKVPCPSRAYEFAQKNVTWKATSTANIGSSPRTAK